MQTKRKVVRGLFRRMSNFTEQCDGVWKVPTIGARRVAAYPLKLPFWSSILLARGVCRVRLGIIRISVKLATTFGFRFISPGTCKVEGEVKSNVHVDS